VPGLGLVYMDQRYYDPAIGRFISPDPIGYAGGFKLNLYAYAENDPDNGVDPLGLETWTVRWRYAIGGTVGEASSMAGRLEMKPEYPLRVTFDDGEEWTLETPDEVECNLEWFDSEDGDDSAVVIDRNGRPVRLKVEKLTLLTCELKEDPEGRQPPE
jgi:uncharacterized protein RhaS with RHS repeats